MVAVLVHGVPETTAVWDPVVASLARLGVPEPRRWSPPGFGAPLPAGFVPSPQAYRAALIEELERIGEPVDLVGHDWGGTHVLGVAMTRPDLLRSWASDTGGSLDPDYVWHDVAQTWQRPGDGEAAIEKMLAMSDEERTGYLVERGMAAATAQLVAPAFDATMGDCILRLYRAAAQPVMADLGGDLENAAARLGLAILALADHVVGTDAQRRRSAARAVRRWSSLRLSDTGGCRSTPTVAPGCWLTFGSGRAESLTHSAVPVCLGDNGRTRHRSVWSVDRWFPVDVVAVARGAALGRVPCFWGARGGVSCKAGERPGRVHRTACSDGVSAS